MGISGVTTYGDDVAGGVTNGAYLEVNGRSVAWHGNGPAKDSKGNVVGYKRPITGDPRTVDEILDLANINWQVTPKLLSELGVTYDGADQIKVIVREDAHRLLGVHSEKYGALQNRTCAGFLAEILKHAPDGKLVAVTELFGGQVLFGVIQFDKGIEAVRRNGKASDRITRYMGVYWSHNADYALGVKFMNELWVCRNTFTPTKGVTGLTVRHTRNAEDLAGTAIKAIEGMVKSNDEFDREVNRLLDIEANTETLKRVVLPTVLGQRPKDEGRTQTIFDNAFAAIVAEWDEYTDQSTAFDAVMAVQGWEQHRATTRGNRDVTNIRRILKDDYPRTRLAAGCFEPISFS